MRPTLTTKQTAISLAVLAAIGLAEWLSPYALNIRRPVGLIICTVLGLTGLFIWRRSTLPWWEEIPQVFEGEPIPQAPPRPLHQTAKYWGVMLFLAASILSVVSFYRFPSAAPPAPNFSAAPQAKPEFQFPPVELKILILDGQQSSILLNGEVLRVGEFSKGIRVVSMDGRYVTLEFNGHTNVIFVPK